MIVFLCVRLHKQIGHVFKHATDVELEPQWTLPDLQRCQRWVSDGKMEEEKKRKERKKTGNREGMSRRHPDSEVPCQEPWYSSPFVILPQMFSLGQGEWRTQCLLCVWVVG